MEITKLNGRIDLDMNQEQALELIEELSKMVRRSMQTGEGYNTKDVIITEGENSVAGRFTIRVSK